MNKQKRCGEYDNQTTVLRRDKPDWLSDEALGKLEAQTEKEIESGEQTKEDLENATIMFNLHKDRGLLPITEARKRT